MTPEQVYSVARQAGFPPDTAVKMVAIAMRESSLQPMAFNGNAATGDKSYGLWQINMLGAMGAERRRILGLSTDEQLFDPLANARAAYWLWGGNDGNLARHWYINRTGPPYYYAEKYQGFLPRAEVARIAVEGGGPPLPTPQEPPVTGPGTIPTPTFPGVPAPVFPGAETGDELDLGTVVVLAAAGLLLYSILS